MTSEPKRQLKAGRPAGATSTDPVIAKAFGRAVVTMRTARGISQEVLALKASVDRSFMGRLERGLNVPNLVGVVKIAVALECSLGELVDAFEKQFRQDPPHARR